RIIDFSKNKSPAKIGRGKGIELLSDVALLEEVRLRETMRKSKQETHKLQAGGSSEGVDFELEVPDEHFDKTKDTSEGTDDNDDDDGIDDDSGNDADGGNNAQDSKQTDSDDNNLSFTLKDYEEEEQEEENVLTLEKYKYDNEDMMYEEEDDDIAKELYGDLNIRDSEIPTRLMLNKVMLRLYAFGRAR
nr:hypothetical protein [Tanacetum cinerariifolium]